jgi:hypothetical protein
MVFFGFRPFRFSDQGILHIYYFTRLGFFMHAHFGCSQCLKQPVQSKFWCSPLFGCRRLVIQHIRKTIHIWRPSPPSASRGRAVPWWRYTLTQSLNTHRKKSVFPIKVLPHCSGEPGLCSQFSDLLRAGWLGV